MFQIWYLRQFTKIRWLSSWRTNYLNWVFHIVSHFTLNTVLINMNSVFKEHHFLHPGRTISLIWFFELNTLFTFLPKSITCTYEPWKKLSIIKTVKNSSLIISFKRWKAFFYYGFSNVQVSYSASHSNPISIKTVESRLIMYLKAHSRTLYYFACLKTVLAMVC